jgi:hypothetical protein
MSIMIEYVTLFPVKPNLMLKFITIDLEPADRF